MCKRVNVKSLLQAKDTLDEKGFECFLAHYGISIKDAELEDLRSLANVLEKSGCNVGALSGFYIGYTIPQIGKEFDLLRFGKDAVLNIEVKSKSTEDKIKKQLVRNKYYLSFIGRKIYALTYVSESQEIYFLNDDEHLEKVKIELFLELLSQQVLDEIKDPNELFNPSDYLVSPFNSTSKFLSGKYFLTKQQESIKNEVTDLLKSSHEAKFISIIGSAGTGKTLLTYDIVKNAILDKKKTLIIHCGLLNHGHDILIENGWVITPIKSYGNYELTQYDLIIIDEAQRIYPNQLEAIIEKAKLAKCCCIFSHDKLQTLAGWEEKRDVSAKIAAINPITEYKLSEKIRTNKEIAAFMKMLFSKNRSVPIQGDGNIEINYFGTDKDAKNYLAGLDATKWEILRFTPSQYSNEHHKKYSREFSKTSHQVIGQEFDGVVATVDKFFSYEANGNLIYNGKAYYDPPKMLFQNITRARNKLNIVIIGNAELLSRCISILQ